VGHDTRDDGENEEGGRKEMRLYRKDEKNVK
jgi:hypothetical protein